MTNKPACRKCGEVPDKPYPPSRIEKKDWICNSCANAVRNKWWSQYRLRKRKAKDFKGTHSNIAALEAQMEFVEIMEDRPACPFCHLKMLPTRTYKDRGSKLQWVCKPCNDIILAREL